MSAGFRERAVRFGEREQLAGILTLPAGRPRAAALLATAGLTPKAGPFRLYAELARRLASEGLAVLRFDLGGIGDSVQVYGSLPRDERAVLELGSAARVLRESAPEGSLIVGGLCSGAEDAARFAGADADVSGVFMIDTFAYRTAGWRRRDALIRAARRGLALAGLLPTAGAKPAGLVDYEPMGLDASAPLLAGLVARRVRLHFVYTGGARETFNHRGQFRAMFPGVDFRGMASLDYYPQLRHTQALEADRELVVGSVARAIGSMLP